jgi:chemotaxis protein MotB
MRKLLPFLFPLVVACGVPKSQYDAAVAEADKVNKAKLECEANAQAAKAAAQKDIDDLQAQLADAQGKAAASDEATRAELDELRRQKAAAEARLKLFDEFLAKFKSMIDAGKLEITVRRGQIVLALATDVLFDTGKTDIKPDGKAALTEVATALKGVTGRRFQVAGHTDPVPIKTKEFPSNWELSTARGVAVVKLLVEKGVRSDVLSAAGYAEFDPVQSNASDKGKQKNRRIEIVLVPNVEELVKMPEVGKRKDDAAKPKDDTAKPKDDTAKPKDDTAKPKDDTAKPKDDTTKPKDTPKPKK